MRTRFAVILVMLALAAGRAYCLDEFLSVCLRMGEDRDEKLKVAREQVDLGKMRTFRSARNFFPGLSFQRKYSRGETSQKNQPEANAYQAEEIGLKMTQPIYDGGRLRASYRYDAKYLTNAKLNYTKMREDLFYRIKTSYYEMLTSRSEHKRLQSTFEEIERLFRKCEVEFKAKAISDLDLEEARNFRDKVDILYKTAHLNATLAQSKLVLTLNVNTLDDIIVPIQDGIFTYPDDINLTLEECKKFTLTNNVDLKISQINIQMSEERRKISRAKVIPRFYLEGYYGQSGEVFVNDPMQLAATWNAMARLQWGIWGNSLEIVQQQDKTNPSEVIDTETKVENRGYSISVGLMDDLSYFIDSKESLVGVHQSNADYQDYMTKALYDLEKFYNSYLQSLWNFRNAKAEIDVKERKLRVLRKKNELYEVSTLEVMDGAYKFAEAVSNYTRALMENYQAVCELERLVLVPLR